MSIPLKFMGSRGLYTARWGETENPLRYRFLAVIVRNPGSKPSRYLLSLYVNDHAGKNIDLKNAILSSLPVAKRRAQTFFDSLNLAAECEVAQ